MTMQAETLAERVARIEGAMEHLATRADLQRLAAELRKDMQRLAVALVSLQLAGVGIMLAAIRLWM